MGGPDEPLVEGARGAEGGTLCCAFGAGAGHLRPRPTNQVPAATHYPSLPKANLQRSGAAGELLHDLMAAAHSPRCLKARGGLSLCRCHLPAARTKTWWVVQAPNAVNVPRSPRRPCRPGAAINWDPGGRGAASIAQRVAGGVRGRRRSRRPPGFCRTWSPRSSGEGAARGARAARPAAVQGPRRHAEAVAAALAAGGAGAAGGCARAPARRALLVGAC